MAADAVKNPDSVLSAVSPYSFKKSNISAAGSVVISFQCRNAVSIRPDHGYSFYFFRIQRKYSIVFKQNHAFFSGSERKRGIFIRICIGYRNLVIFTVIIEQAEKKACCENAFAGSRDFIF